MNAGDLLGLLWRVASLARGLQRAEARLASSGENADMRDAHAWAQKLSATLKLVPFDGREPERVAAANGELMRVVVELRAQVDELEAVVGQLELREYSAARREDDEEAAERDPLAVYRCGICAHLFETCTCKEDGRR